MANPSDVRAADVCRARRKLFASPEMQRRLERLARLRDDHRGRYWASAAEVAALCGGIFDLAGIDNLVVGLPVYRTQLQDLGEPMLAVGFTRAAASPGQRARALSAEVLDRAVRSIAYQLGGLSACEADARVARELYDAVKPDAVRRDRHKLRERARG